MSESLALQLERYRRAGIDVDTDRVPAPERHRPNAETHVSNGYVGIVVKEPDSGAFIHCEEPVGVRQ